MGCSYYTKDGILLIKKEFNYIWYDLRPKVVEKLAWAASLGDRSENADYQYNKQLLRQIDRRVKFISDILDFAQVLDRSKEGITKNIILFGAFVEIENDDGIIKHVRIVNSNETYNRKGFISFESPMAKALINLTIDDEAIVKTPKGLISWYVNKISYEIPKWFGQIDEPQFIFSEKTQTREYKILSDEEIARIKKDYLATLIDK
ncbi:MAG: GreA/GreB family elongation factor [Succinivibrionaceae bacterium]